MSTTRSEPSPWQPPRADEGADAMRSRIAARLFDAEESPATIGRFEIVRTLGTGGMGVVYLCRDPQLGRNVAIKLLHHEAPGGRERARLLREAHALARLAHPNVVSLFEVGRSRQRTFLAMEHIAGTPLSEWLDDQPRTWSDIVGVFVQAGRGLAAAHEAGLVHRDFKPANVLVGEDGRVRVVDFGLARGLAGEASGSGSSSPVVTSSPLGTVTRPGGLAGTPVYMSPEQRRRRRLDARSDQWSFCVSLWEALYQTRPYDPEQLEERSVLPRWGRDNGPRVLRRVVARGLAFDEDARWPRMEELVDALEQTRSRGPSARGRSVLLGVGVLALATVVLASTEDRCAPDVEAMASVWDPDRRRAAERAVAETGRFVDSFRWMGGRLDAYRDRWIDTAQTICRGREGAWSSDRVRLARECLARSRAGAVRLVDALIEDPEATLVGLADTNDRPTWLQLADPRTCLIPLADDKPTEHGASSMLVEAAALDASGQTELARAWAAGALGAATSVGDVRTRIQAHWMLGALELDAGWTQRGIEHLVAAVSTAEASGMDDAAVHLWSSLTNAALMHLHDAEQARAWLGQLEAKTVRVGAPPELKLLVARHRGVLASMSGQSDVALRSFDEAEALAGNLGDMATDLLERLSLDRGNHQLSLGRPDAATVEYERAAMQRMRRLGGEHPSLAEIEIALGRAAQHSERFDRAERHFARAAKLVERAYGERSPRLSSPLIGLADAHLYRGDVEAARRHATRAAELQAGLPPEHPERGGAHALLGMIAEALGDSRLAAEHFSAAAHAREGLPDQTSRREAVNNAAWHLIQTGDWERARGQYEWLKEHTEEGAQLHVFALAGLGRAQDLGGSSEAAVSSLEAALEAARQLDDPHPELVPEVQWHLAEALARVGDELPRARTLAAKALAAYRASWPERHDAIEPLARLTGQGTTTKEGHDP